MWLQRAPRLANACVARTGGPDIEVKHRELKPRSAIQEADQHEYQVVP
jgi:hypothetical protein